MDTVTPEQRSKIMSRIRSRDTKPEILVRKMLHANGYRFRVCDRRMHADRGARLLLASAWLGVEWQKARTGGNLPGRLLAAAVEQELLAGEVSPQCAARRGT